jgi:DNA-binding MarR family transcriptional regulator
VSAAAAGQVATWRAVLDAQSTLMRLYERELARDCGISLAWYDVLIHLAEAPDGTMRMNELADSLLLSRSWLSRRIDAMQAAGLVRRCQAADDRRGVCATLTSEGRRVHQQADRSHARSISNHFSRFLAVTEAETIEACFRRIGQHAHEALHVPGYPGTKEGNCIDRASRDPGRRQPASSG